MRKLFLLLSAILPVAMAVRAQDPPAVAQYDFNEGESEWTILDANEDGTTWMHEDSYYPDYGWAMKYRYSSKQAANDYLISPAVHLEKGSYILSVDYLGGFYPEKLALLYGTAPTAEGLTQELFDVTIHSSEWANRQVLFTVSATGNYHFGLHIKSAANAGTLYVDKFKITTARGNDLILQEVVSPTTGYNLSDKEKVQVKVLNNGIKEQRNVKVSYTLDEQATVTEIIPSLPAGTVTTYTFSETVNLSAVADHTLSVKVEDTEDDLPQNNSLSLALNHYAVATVPYFMGFEPEEETRQISLYNVNEDTGFWSFKANSYYGKYGRTGAQGAVYSYDKVNSGDDWMILPPVHLEPGSYALKFWYSTSREHVEKFSVHYGTGNKPGDMTTHVHTYDNAKTSDTFVEAAHVISVSQAGDYYIGFHAISDKDEDVLCIDDFSLEAIEQKEEDLAITNFSLDPQSYFFQGMKGDVTYSLVNNGLVEATDATVTISVDEEIAQSYTLNLTPQSTVVKTAEGLLDKLSAGNHSIQVSISHPADRVAENNTVLSWVKVLTKPVKEWTAESGKIDGGLTMRTEDKGIVHSSLQDYFPNNEAFGIIELETHPIYGNFMYCATSYFTDTTIPANRWLVLPEVEVRGEEADFVWMAASFGAKYPETYSVLISEKEDQTADYTLIRTFTNEQAIEEGMRVHGIDLSSYKGKKIRIAFNLTTPSGDMLLLDNLKLFGNLSVAEDTALSGPDAQGIAQDAAPRVFLSQDGELICTSAHVKSLSLYSVTGNLIGRADNSNRLFVGSLPGGTYIVQIVTANGSQSLKIMQP